MIIFLDQDCVLADFIRSPAFPDNYDGHYNPSEMYEKFFFENLPPVKGALSGVRELLKIKGVELHILTQPVKETHYSYSEKVAWIGKWFPELLGSVTLTQNKELMSGPGRILLDDNADKWKNKWEKHGGKFVHFNYETEKHTHEWKKIVSEIKAIVNNKPILEAVQ